MSRSVLLPFPSLPARSPLKKAAASQTLKVTASRDWNATTDADWISVSPTSGKASKDAQTVTISVLENTGFDREGSVKFDIGFDTKTLAVTQNGLGSAEDLIVYKNDFDKEAATQTYGTGGKYWPMLDQFDGWKNQTGTGAAAVEYAFANVTARNNSNSNGSYSDYPGSGTNNLFFGKNNYFKIGGIVLPSGNRNFTLSFGTEKYLQDADNTFNPSEFHVYVSADGTKWVELSYTFPGAYKNGRWDIASTSFTVPAGTPKLHLGIFSDLASAHRLDDLLLELATSAGTAVDFTKGVEVPALAGAEEPVDYENAPVKSVHDFIAAADANTYYRLKGTVSNFNSQYCSFDLTDETGTIYVYSVANKDEWKDKISNGGTVELAGKYEYYQPQTKHEVVDAMILSFTAGELPATKVTVAGANQTDKGKAVILESVLVYAKYKSGIMVGDDTGFILVYNKDGVDANIGDKITVKGIVGEYGGLKQITAPELTPGTTGNAVTYPAAKDITASLDTYAATIPEYISFSGTLTVSDSYYNVTVAGATKQGSIQYPLDGSIPETLVNKMIQVTGFFAGITGTGGKYVSIMMTKIEEPQGAFLGVAPAELTVPAETTTATFSISSNVSWTVSTEIAGVTFDKASGTGNSEVTATFPANTSATDDVVIRIVVAGTGVDAAFVTITQKKAGGALTHALTSNLQANITLGDKAYNNDATVNGDATKYYALKLGTSSVVGNATVNLPAGTKRVGAYVVAWSGKKGKLEVVAGNDVLKTIDANSNAGAAGNPTFNLVEVSDADYYEVILDAALPSDIAVTVRTVAPDYRVIIFGINAYTE